MLLASIFPVIIITVIILWIIFRKELLTIFSSKESLDAWIESLDVSAWIVFLAVQIVQVIIFVIPGEVTQIAGGYIFGFWPGILLTMTGILIGSVFNFSVARYSGRSFMQYIFPERTIKKFDFLTSTGKAKIFFLLFFLLPGIPKDILCFVAGLSPISLAEFLVYSGIGRFPGIIGSVLIGVLSSQSRWLAAGIIFGLAGVLFIFGILFRDKIHVLVERRIKHREGGRT